MLNRRNFLLASGTTLAVSMIRRFVPAAPAASGSVSLCGTPEEVGRRFGEINAGDIREHMNALLGAWREKGLDDRGMIAKSEPLRRFIKKLAPAWEGEFAACAEAAAVDPELYMAFQAGKYRSIFFVQECTSFLAVGDATADGAPLFHKTRDNQVRGQCAYWKALRHASEPAAFHATGDTSDVGVMMMVNQHGVAGSADMGGLKVKKPKGDGVMNPYILRLIAERAERVEDALEIIQMTIRDGWYAGGASSGTNWSFADRLGKGLRVRQNNYEEEHWFVQDDIAFSVREDTPGADIIKKKKGRITVPDMHAASTHPSMCFPSSVSSMTVRIDPGDPARRNQTWFAIPSWSPYVPFFAPSPATPPSMLDGSSFWRWYDLSKDVQDKNYGKPMRLSPAETERRDEIQAKLYAMADEASKEINAALDAGDQERAETVARRLSEEGASLL